MLTIAALGLAVVASAMTLPAYIQSLDWSGRPEDPISADWTAGPWGLAFPLGVASSIVGIMALRRQRRGGSELGLRLAGCAVGLSVLGAIVWTYVFMLAADAGM